MANKPKSDQQQLLSELTEFLTTPHGNIDQAVEDIAKALDHLIDNANETNKKTFAAAIKKAATLPKATDQKIAAALRNILENAAQVLNNQLSDLTALNEAIKQEKQRLKQRINEIEQQSAPGRKLK